jgi:hypothetical protein
MKGVIGRTCKIIKVMRLDKVYLHRWVKNFMNISIEEMYNIQAVYDLPKTYEILIYCRRI